MKKKDLINNHRRLCYNNHKIWKILITQILFGFRKVSICAADFTLMTIPCFNIETIVKKIERKLAKIGTVYPTEPALVLCSDGYEIQGQTMKWGYKNPKDNTRIINARSETVLWELPIRLYGSIIDIG